LIRELKPDLVINNGDIVHTQGSITSEVSFATSLSYELVFDACKDVGIECWYMVGNHDKFSDEACVVYTTRFLKFSPQCRVFDKPTVANGIAIIPHFKNSDNLAKEFNKIMSGKISFSHLDVNGARFHDTAVDKHGIPQSVFEPFELSINGHYHLPQCMGKGCYEFFRTIGAKSSSFGHFKIGMPGAPQEFSFREPKSSLGRGVCLIDTEAKTVHMIENTESPRFLRLPVAALSKLSRIPTKDYLMIEAPSEANIDEYLEQLADYKYTVHYDINRSSRIASLDDSVSNNNRSPSELIDLHLSDSEYDEPMKVDIKATGIDLVTKATGGGK
jgi:DNA repair exonuclease SbcCD nuclease subunit